MKLLIKTLVAFLMGLLITGCMLFLPAGTLEYYNAWLFIALLFTPILVMGIVLFIKNPEMLRKRLEMKEREKEQKNVVAFSGLLLTASFIVAGFDHRLGWSHVPNAIIIAASIIQLIGYGLYAEVLRENAFLSRVVEVQENQQVIDTGLYGIVRHPMYTATIFLCLAIGLVLGSWISFVLMLVYPVLILFRIRGEEALLEENQPGYRDYKAKVRWRLIPFLW